MVDEIILILHKKMCQTVLIIVKTVLGYLQGKEKVILYVIFQYPHNYLLIINYTYTNITDCDFPKSVWQHMLCFFCRAITNIWHANLALETPSYSVIYTSRFSPVWLQNTKSQLYHMHKTLKTNIQKN